jgi:hypothetical protein
MLVGNTRVALRSDDLAVGRKMSNCWIDSMTLARPGIKIADVILLRPFVANLSGIIFWQAGTFQISFESVRRWGGPHFS